jgi:hypothetical protein
MKGQIWVCLICEFLYGKTKIDLSEQLYENNWTKEVFCMAIHEWASIQDDLSNGCTSGCSIVRNWYRRWHTQQLLV